MPGLSSDTRRSVAQRMVTARVGRNKSVPPDPYSGDPLSVLFVAFRQPEGLPGYGVDTLGDMWTCVRRGYSVAVAAGLAEPFGYDWWRPLRGSIDKNGYRYASFRVAGATVRRYAHILILSTFLGPRPAGLDCCHRDGHPPNNRLDNLYWGTRADNVADAIRHGTWMHGERSPHAKLNAGLVREIRARHAAGESMRSLAKQYGVSFAATYDVIRGVTWKHVKDQCSG